MKQGLMYVTLLVVLVLGSIGMAANSHQVTVTVPEFVAISVGEDVTMDAEFDVDGNAAPSAASTVSVKTNTAKAYNINAKATPTGALTLPASKLAVNNQSLAASVTAFTHTTGKTNGWKSYDITYQANLNGTEDPGSYTWVVEYTAIAQ